MATMAKPKALAIPNRLTAVGPDPMPPMTAAPQPKNTRAKVPTNSAACLFISPLLPHRNRRNRPYNDASRARKGAGDEGAAARRHFRAAPSSTPAPLLSRGPPLYMRRLFDDPLMNGAALASRSSRPCADHRRLRTSQQRWTLGGEWRHAGSAGADRRDDRDCLFRAVAAPAAAGERAARNGAGGPAGRRRGQIGRA